MADGSDRTKTIDLYNPVKAADGTVVSQLILNPPKTGQRRQAEGHLRRTQTPEDFTRFGVALVAACSGQKEGVIEQLDDDQFMEAFDWVGAFFKSGQTTG